MDLLIVLRGMPKDVFKRQELFMEVEEKLGEKLDELEGQLSCGVFAHHQDAGGSVHSFSIFGYG